MESIQETNQKPESPAELAEILQTEILQLNRNIYLPPELIAAHADNIKARPTEALAARQARVQAMAESIKQIGQSHPVLVIETQDDDDYIYEYVDGGCRVEAIALLNAAGLYDQKRVWCSIVPSDVDLYRIAVSSNIHRTQNSLLDMAHICREVRERNGWKGRGAGNKVAEYLGLQRSRVSEYEKLLTAPPKIMERIISGELPTLDAVMKLLTVEPAQQPAVLERAQEIAQTERRAAKPKKVKPESVDVESEATIPVTEELVQALASGQATLEPNPELEPEPEPIKARHIAAATEEVTGKRLSPRNRADTIEFFEQFSAGAGYAKPVLKFCEYFVETFLPGGGDGKTAVKLFDTMVGYKGASSKTLKLAKPPKPVKPMKARRIAGHLIPAKKATTKTAKPATKKAAKRTNAKTGKTTKQQ